MNIEEEALLRAVLIDPFDDSPRLIYADWLMDHPKRITCKHCSGDTLHRALVNGVTYVNNVPGTCTWCDGQGEKDENFEHATFIKDSIKCKTPRSSIRSSRTEHYLKATGIDSFDNNGFINHVIARPEQFFASMHVLFPKHPITHVELRGVQPLRGDNCCWFFSIPDDSDYWKYTTGTRAQMVPNYVSQSIMDQLELLAMQGLGNVVTLTTMTHAYYDMTHTAFKALSRACVMLGRKEANLPPIKFPGDP